MPYPLDATAPHPDPIPVWPSSFAASMVETTWYGSSMQRHNGSVAYRWGSGGADAAEVITRSISLLNPICNGARPNRTTPCLHHVHGATRFLVWPTESECCVHCTSDCGVLTPTWVTAVPNYYIGRREIGGASCDEWYLHSGTPDRVATQVESGALCEVYDGGADFTGDNPFQWSIDPESYSTTPTAEELALPAACVGAAKC